MSHETIKLNRQEKFDPTECEILIHFKYHPGSPGKGPSYYSGGEPPEPPEIEILKIEANGSDITDLISEAEYESIENKLYEDWESSDYDDRADELYEAYRYEREREEE